MNKLPSNHPIQQLINTLLAKLITIHISRADYKYMLNTITELEQQLPIFVIEGEYKDAV